MGGEGCESEHSQEGGYEEKEERQGTGHLTIVQILHVLYDTDSSDTVSDTKWYYSYCGKTENRRQPQDTLILQPGS